MRAQHPEEAAMLLSAYQQAAQRDADRMRQRRRAARTLFGVAGAAALLVGCIAAVDVFALNGGDADNTMTLQVRTGAQDVDDEAIAMESQFGWNSIGYGWCSLKSSTWCMFSKDKEACKEGINCYKNREKASADDDGDAYEGSGSGDFNATVGDDVEVGEDDDEETPSAAVPATPADNPTEPLDLGGGDEEADDGDEETTEDDDEAPADDEEAPADDEEAPADDEEAPADDEEDAPADDEVADDEEAPAGDEEETEDGETVTEDKDQDDNMGGED